MGKLNFLHIESRQHPISRNKMKHDVRNYVMSCKQWLIAWKPSRHNAKSSPINSTYVDDILEMEIKGPIVPATPDGRQSIFSSTRSLFKMDRCHKSGDIDNWGNHHCIRIIFQSFRCWTPITYPNGSRKKLYVRTISFVLQTK